ncbi:AaceriAFL078Wp [[Ashbya] aceris (nom. inval.)]|nr:AaceriAFL078Wp [[Ashbya] aceris (nom. inval.)]
MDGWRSRFKRLHRTWSLSEEQCTPTIKINSPDATPQTETCGPEDEGELPPVQLCGYLGSTRDRLLTAELCAELRPLMPSRIQLYTKWCLLYSLEQHGASLHSLYEHVRPEEPAKARVGYLLIIRDRRGGLFGAYANEPFRPTESRRYSGNGECFLWSADLHPMLRLRVYPYTGINEFCIYCTSGFLSMGAGSGHYGLWCDEGLVHGVSERSPTFGNDALSREGPRFHIVALEVWRVG